MEPFAIIEDFFSAIPLPQYRKYIFSMLKAANSKNIGKRKIQVVCFIVKKR